MKKKLNSEKNKAYELYTTKSPVYLIARIFQVEEKHLEDLFGIKQEMTERNSEIDERRWNLILHLLEKINLEENKGESLVDLEDMIEMASYGNTLKILRFLARHAPSSLLEPIRGVSPASIAASLGNPEMIRLLIDEGRLEDLLRPAISLTLLEDPEMPPVPYVTSFPIYKAACNGDIEMIDLLFEKDPSSLMGIGNQQQPPKDAHWSLHRRYRWNENCHDFSETPAGGAAKRGDFKTLQYLERLNADYLKAQDRYGGTAASEAAKAGNVDILKYLWARVPEIFGIRTMEGRTLAHDAVTAETLEFIAQVRPDLLTEKDDHGSNVGYLIAQGTRDGDKKFEILVKYAPHALFAPDESHGTPVQKLARSSNFDKVEDSFKLLVAKKSELPFDPKDFAVRDVYGQTLFRYLKFAKNNGELSQEKFDSIVGLMKELNIELQ